MSDTYQDLIRQLREEATLAYEHDVREIPNSSHYLPLEDRSEWQAADALEALVKERDTALRDGERRGLEAAIGIADAESVTTGYTDAHDVYMFGQGHFHARKGIATALRRRLITTGE